MKENDYVIIMYDDDNFKIARLRKGSNVRLKSKLVDIEYLIGKPYGKLYYMKDTEKTRKVGKNKVFSLFTFDEYKGEDGTLLGETQLLKDRLQALEDEKQLILDLQSKKQVSFDSHKTTSLYDALLESNPDKRQKLSEQDLQSKKLQGVDVIEALLENNVTTDSKNSMQRDKYVRRKLKTHNVIIRPVKTNCETLCKALVYGYNLNGKLGSIRYGDSMSQLLLQANLFENARVLCMESFNGFITASIMERLGKQGRIINLVDNVNKNKLFYDYFNFTKEDTKTRLCQLEFIDHPKIPLNSMDSLVLACEYNTSLILPKLLKYLKYSAPFIIHSKYYEELVAIKEILFSRKNQQENNYSVLDLHIYDLFFREMQVLPSKTHPMMQMKGESGFFLRGIRLNPNRVTLKRFSELDLEGNKINEEETSSIKEEANSEVDQTSKS